MAEFTREALKAYFETNPREWAKVAPIDAHTAECIERLAEKHWITGPRFLNFHSRKDAVERTDEADCMKHVVRLFRSDAEQLRLDKVKREALEEMERRPPRSGAQGPEVERRPMQTVIGEKPCE